jgi:phage shock protein C
VVDHVIHLPFMTHTDIKLLYRSERNRMLAGVCGGLGEYTDTDPVLIRLLWVLITIFTGFAPGIIAYLLAIVIIPRQATSPSPTATTTTNGKD